MAVKMECVCVCVCVCVCQSFDECVANDGLDCSPKDLWLQIPFFCGQHAECWSVSFFF